MQAARIDTPNVHGGAFANRVQAFQDFDIFAGIF
jgi:hypothetical protein